MHGTGTPLGDPIEIGAATAVLKGALSLYSAGFSYMVAMLHFMQFVCVSFLIHDALLHASTYALQTCLDHVNMSSRRLGEPFV